MSPDTDYEWVRSPGSPVDAATVAVVSTLAPRQCLDVLAPDRQTDVLDAEEIREWAEEQDDPYGTALEAGSVAGWTLVYENNGYRAVSAGMPEKLSERGVMLGVYRGGQGVTRFVCARDGVVVRKFEPGLPWSQVGTPLPEEADLDLDGPDGYVNLFRILERVTGSPLASGDLRDTAGRVAVGLHPA